MENNRVKKKQHNNRGVLGLMVLFVFLVMLVSGCKKMEEEDSTIFLQEEKKDIFNYTYVQRGDVVLSHEVMCEYIQSKSEEYSFSVKNRIIKNITVNEGDQVKKGQLLGELDNDDAKSKMKESNYVITKNTLLLKQAEAQKKSQLQEAKSIYEASPKSSSDKESYNSKVNAVQETYNQNKETYQNTIQIEKLKLETYKKQEEESKIYSTLTGTVSFVKPNMVGSYSVPDDVLITIVDNLNCVYVSKDMEYKKYFIDDKTLDLHVKTAGDDLLYKIKSTNQDNWKENMIFQLVDENFAPKVGDYGYLYAIMGHKENVLYVDSKAVHKANDKYYVYVLNNKGNREMKYVEIGLVGNSTTEIISGLNEGEKIILKMESFWGE